MKRFFVLFLIQSIVYFLSIVSISIDIIHINLPLALASSIIGGLLGAALLSLFFLKKRLTADIDFTDSEDLPKSRELKQYSYSYNWKKIVIPFISFMLLISFFAVMRLRNYGDNYRVFAPMFIIAAISIIGVIDTSMMKIIISEKNIEYQSLFGKTKASWEDILGAMQIIRGDEVLIFQKMYYSNIFVEAINGDYISISIFDRKWKTGELGKIIQTFAPQLKFIERPKDK